MGNLFIKNDFKV